MVPTDRVRGAADATVAAGTARVSLTAHDGGSLPTRMDGVTDFTRRRSSARLTLQQADAATSVDCEVTIEAIIDGPIFYVQVLELPGRWLRTRLDEHDEQMPAGDPGLVLDWLRGCVAAQPASDVADVDGLDVIDAMLDLDEAVAAAPTRLGRAIRGAIDLVAPDRMPRDARVWLDRQDLVHRLDIGAPAGWVELRLSDHGVPIDVELPDDETIIEPDELADLLPE